MKQSTDDISSGFLLEFESCGKKMRLLVHSAKQVVTVTKNDVNFLSGQSMKSVDVLENDNGGVAVAVDE
jgi:hypothetical protein